MEAVKRGSKTTLKLGLVEAPIKLYKATGKEEKGVSFVTAGPNGKPLRMEKRAVEADVDAADPTDVFGLSEDGVDDGTVVPAAVPVVEDPGPEEIPPIESSAVGSGSAIESAPGEFKAIMVEEETGEEVEPEDVRRGVRLDDGTFVDLTDQLAAIDEQSKLDRLEVLDFIRRERVPRERVVGAYYLAAGDKGNPMRVLRILYEAMKRTERVAIIRWTKMKGQSLGILIPHGSGALVVLEVAFADAARKPNSACLAHMRAEVKESQVDRAVELVESMNAPPAALDDYFDRRAQLQRDLAQKAEEKGDLSEFAVVEKPASEMEELDDLLSRAVG